MSRPAGSINYPIPSLEETFWLVAGLPDTVSASVISLLLWLRRFADSEGRISASNEDLAQLMHVSLSTVKRTISDAQAFVTGAYTYEREGRNRMHFEPPNMKGGMHSDFGRFVGKVFYINWKEIKQLSDAGRVKLSRLPQAKMIDTEGGSKRATGEVGESIKFSSVSAPSNAISSEDWSAFIDRLNEIYREVQHRSGVKRPKNPVRGTSADWRIRAFVQKQEPSGRWTAWERVANWFSLWVENHELKNLQFPSSNFVREAEEFKPQLLQWEASNPTVRWREFPPLVNPSIKIITDAVYSITGITATQSVQQSVGVALQQHDVETVKAAFAFAFRGSASTGGRDLRERVCGFFSGDHIEAALESKRVEEEEAGRLQEEQKRRNEAMRADTVKVVTRQERAAPKPVIGDELRIIRMVGATIDQFQERDARLTNSRGQGLNFASRELEHLITKTEKELGVIVDAAALSAIFEDERVGCGEDCDALSNFGTRICQTIIGKLYERLAKPTGVETV